MNPENLTTHTLRTAPWGRQMAEIMAAALEAVDPYRAVHTHLCREGNTLHAGGRIYELDRFERVLLVGAGKAGLPMAQAAVEVLEGRVSAGQVTVKEGHHAGLDSVGPVRIAQAGHPLPDERGVESTQAILALLEGAGENDLALCLISGGGSALLTAPVGGLTLDGLRALTDRLLAGGASIQEINTLRKRLDWVKGGGLAQAAAPAQVLALILSDVVGDPLDMIASGPTVPNPDSHAEALAVVERYGLADLLSPALLDSWRNEPEDGAAPFPHVQNLLVGNNRAAAEAALEKAAALGFQTELLTTTMTGEAREVGREMGEKLRALAADPILERPFLALAGGETTVTLRGAGQGGRNQELALAAVEALAGVENAALITLATDGGDGPTDAAGAVVTGETLARAKEMGLDPAEFLRNNDSYTFFSRLGDCLKPGPTRTNVNDLVFCLVV